MSVLMIRSVRVLMTVSRVFVIVMMIMPMLAVVTVGMSVLVIRGMRVVVAMLAVFVAMRMTVIGFVVVFVFASLSAFLFVRHFYLRVF
jgi:hypothetical protein